jgi:hypothetical protein
MLLIVVFPFLHVLNLDVHCETLGHKLNLVAEAFNQHAGVPLDLFDPLVGRIEASIEPLFLPFEALIQQGMEPSLLPVKAFLKVLNEFLVHTASAVSRIGCPTVLVNETRQMGKR